MAYLFEIKGHKVYPNPETLLIEPFKSIWERDVSKDKSLAIKELSYIEFMSSARNSNPFQGYPEKAKGDIIRKELFDDENWKPDELIQRGLDKIEDFQTEGSTAYTYYMAAKTATENLRDFLNEVDLHERNNRDMPLYKPAEITRALNDTEKVLQNLTALKKKVDEELFESTRTKGDKPISPFADPGSLK